MRIFNEILYRLGLKKRPSFFRPGAWNQLLGPGLRKQYELSYNFSAEEYKDIPECTTSLQETSKSLNDGVGETTLTGETLDDSTRQKIQ